MTVWFWATSRRSPQFNRSKRSSRFGIRKDVFDEHVNSVSDISLNDWSNKKTWLWLPNQWCLLHLTMITETEHLSWKCWFPGKDFPLIHPFCTWVDLLWNVYPRTNTWVLSSPLISPGPTILRDCLQGKEQIGLLYRRFYRHAHQHTLKALFVTLINPHLEYGKPVWDSHLLKEITALEAVQKFSKKYVLNCGILWIIRSVLINSI